MNDPLHDAIREYWFKNMGPISRALANNDPTKLYIEIRKGCDKLSLPPGVAGRIWRGLALSTEGWQPPEY